MSDKLFAWTMPPDGPLKPGSCPLLVLVRGHPRVRWVDGWVLGKPIARAKVSPSAVLG
jgi:hypothetical protein